MASVLFIPITSPIQTTGSAFSVANPLGADLNAVQITMAAPGEIWLDPTDPFDDNFIYLHTSDPTVAIQAFLTLQSATGTVPSSGTGFCQISDVCAEYPTFQRNAANSVSDAQIQNWINRGAARIKAAFFKKGIDLTQPTLPNGQALSFDQLNWLCELNEDYAASKLGSVLQSSVTLQPGEITIAGTRRKAFEAAIAGILKGDQDAYFGIGSSIANSFGGAETDKSTPGERGENRFFGKNNQW